jgi:hypothetical protein
MNWFRDNWGNIFGVFLAIVVAGIIGFYSAIISLKGEIGQLKIEIARLKVELSKSVIPKLKDIDSHAAMIAVLEKTVIVLTNDAEHLKGETKTLSQQTNSFLMYQWKNGAQPVEKP